ncbi:DDE-type integrase/transposase/recombinase [Flavobacterium sp.]|uniref:DDE-type integrase/transposase/recombinase n=1 Tax=Flavobacterium sp. TaxID=239 RepID=UPI00286E124C|nr:DDE-type integrase/transposase/recombinase [Flavobacterium sp.]
MAYKNSRISWDTSVKHYIRFGLYDNLPSSIQNKISPTNKHRWINESDSKYLGCEVSKFIKDELALLKRTGQNNNAKRILEGYFALSDTYNDILSSVGGIKKQLANQKEKLVNVIENLKEFIPIDTALTVFNISRATYQNYKNLVLNKCGSSYFEWCVTNYPNQLLKNEVSKIKHYLENKDYQFWSKSSLYLLALRNKEVSVCLATFYKYAKLLGFNGNRHLQVRAKYSSLKSYYPNEIWCADVTILKTSDGAKHYIHFLMDHFSKKILGFAVEESSKPIAIRDLLKEAYSKYKNKLPIQFVTDAGIENVNLTVKDFIATTNLGIKHLIAQKDIPFSNSKIEAFNKIIKHQFLLPKPLENRKQLLLALDEVVPIYNGIRPQLSLKGNTPNETFAGKALDSAVYKTHFEQQKALRIAKNQKSKCNSCKV